MISVLTMMTTFLMFFLHFVLVHSFVLCEWQHLFSISVRGVVIDSASVSISVHVVDIDSASVAISIHGVDIGSE